MFQPYPYGYVILFVRAVCRLTDLSPYLYGRWRCDDEVVELLTFGVFFSFHVHLILSFIVEVDRANVATNKLSQNEAYVNQIGNQIGSCLRGFSVFMLKQSLMI